MEKKKMELWKKILIGVLAIILILAVLILVRYNILTQIQERNEEINNRTNIYYYSEADDTLMEFWKKDEIIKVNIKQRSGNGDITYWTNTSTNERFSFWNEAKLYSQNNDFALMDTRIPNGMIFGTDNTARLLMAATPTLFIGSQNYENKDCYKLEIDESQELIEKSTGLILYSNNGMERKVSYEFDIVTDSDIQMPDITQYTLVTEG